MSSKEYLDLFGNRLEVGDKVFILRASLPSNVKPDPSKVYVVHATAILGFNGVRLAAVITGPVGRTKHVNKFPHNVVKVSSSMSSAELKLHAKILFPNATDITI